MRWRFADPNCPEEAAYVRGKLAAIDHWWRAFQSKTSDLEALFKRRSDWDLPQFMEDTLQAVDPRLMWEFGGAVRGPGHRLVITPESQRWLRPMLRTILERAPKIAGWEFYPYRLAETAEQTIDTVKGRVGVDITGALIDASVAPGRKVDLNFAFPGQRDLDEQTAMHAAFVATETLMGEQVLDTWIGAIDLMDDQPVPGSRPLPLERAQATVAALIRGSIDQLPAVPTQDISVEKNWATVKLEPPEPANDYPGRSDLVVASTHDVELFQAMHSGQSFSSSCHSRLGEQFCYLKLDGADVPGGGLVEFRSAFEDALNPALLAASAGCCMGGGSGLRYAYIDLALTDLKQAVPILRETLAERQAPVRSWLLFHDDDLAAEWIGIHPATPPPPEPPSEE
jgi:hypothetical protein